MVNPAGEIFYPQQFMEEISDVCNQAKSMLNAYPVKAVRIACDKLDSLAYGYVGGRVPYLLENQWSTDELINLVKPLSPELAQNINELHQKLITVVRTDLPPAPNFSCGPDMEKSTPDNIVPLCFEYKKDLKFSPDTVEDFKAKTKLLLSNEAERQETIIYATMGIALVILGIAAVRGFVNFQKNKKLQTPGEIKS